MKVRHWWCRELTWVMPIPRHSSSCKILSRFVSVSKKSFGIFFNIAFGNMTCRYSKWSSEYLFLLVNHASQRVHFHINANEKREQVRFWQTCSSSWSFLETLSVVTSHSLSVVEEFGSSARAALCQWQTLSTSTNSAFSEEAIERRFKEALI